MKHTVGHRYIIKINTLLHPTDKQLNGKVATLNKIAFGLEFDHVCLIDGNLYETAFKASELIPYEEFDESEIWE